jgi:hypothetical protein
VSNHRSDSGDRYHNPAVTTTALGPEPSTSGSRACDEVDGVTVPDDAVPESVADVDAEDDWVSVGGGGSGISSSGSASRNASASSVSASFCKRDRRSTRSLLKACS